MLSAYYLLRTIRSTLTKILFLYDLIRRLELLPGTSIIFTICKYSKSFQLVNLFLRPLFLSISLFHSRYDESIGGPNKVVDFDLSRPDRWSLTLTWGIMGRNDGLTHESVVEHHGSRCCWRWRSWCHSPPRGLLGRRVRPLEGVRVGTQ